jgi:secondary thiamine-phosphate synthase enzyme
MLHKSTLDIATRGIGLYEITSDLARVVREAGIDDGIAVVFVQHTSASLVIQENADPRVKEDIVAFMARLVPEGDPIFTHDEEGPDDMPSHIRSLLSHTSEVIPVGGGRLLLGTWQGLFLFEHRRAPRRRRVEVRVFD